MALIVSLFDAQSLTDEYKTSPGASESTPLAAGGTPPGNGGYEPSLAVPTATINKTLTNGIYLHTKKGPKKVHRWYYCRSSAIIKFDLYRFVRSFIHYAGQDESLEHRVNMVHERSKAVQNQHVGCQIY